MATIKVGDNVVATNPLTAEKLGKIIEIYKVKNPVKYAMKKEALDKQLAELRGIAPAVEVEAEEVKQEDAPVAPKAPKAPKVPKAK